MGPRGGALARESKWGMGVTEPTNVDRISRGLCIMREVLSRVVY
jgi:hypothetical protein